MDGNSHGSNGMTSYNCTNKQWTEHPPLPEERIGCAAAVLNQHEFVVVGGSTDDKDRDKFTYLYNTTTKSWIRLLDLKKRRAYHACVCVDNKVYAIGGANKDDMKFEDTIEMLDLSVPQPSWKVLPSRRMKHGRCGCAAVVDYNGDIVVMGGLNFNSGDLLSSLEVFDTHNQVWKPTQSLPSMLTGRSFFSLVALKSGRILVALGGLTIVGKASPSVELLVLENDGNAQQWMPMPSMNAQQWMPMPSMNDSRSGFAAFATTTTTQPGILVAGGVDNDDNVLDTMEFLHEPSEEDRLRWTLLSRLPANNYCDQVWARLPTTIPTEGRTNFAYVQLNNELHFVGGWDENLSDFNKRVTSYNCTTNEWTERPPLPERRSHCAAVVFNQHEFVVVGGATDDKDRDKSTYLYNTKTKSWTRLPDLEKRRCMHACICVGKKVYAIGGANKDDVKDEDSIEMLDLSVPQPSWTVLPTRMKQGRTGCAAAVDYNGDIVVTGGFNIADRFLSNVEVFDTHNQVWKPTRLLPQMQTGRSGHSLVALKCGRILVALGGSTNTDFASTSVEFLVLDGCPPEWTPMQPMKVGRCFFAAFATTTTTQPGILVAGGQDNGIKALDTMEFLQEPSEQGIIYWSLLNGKGPVLATEDPIGDTTIHEPPQSEEWIQYLEREKNHYYGQVLDTMVSIRQRMDMENPPPTATTTRRAIPPEERIKRLRETVDQFVKSVNTEIKLVRQSGQVGLSGAVAVGKAPDASSVSSLSAQSEETLGRPDLAPDAQGRKRTATRAELPYVAPNQSRNALFRTFQQGSGSGQTLSGFVDGRSARRKMGPMLTYAALQQEEHQDTEKEEAAEDVETPQRSEGGNPSGSNKERQGSNPPSSLSVSSDSPPMEICVGGMEESSQAPSSIGSMSFHRLNAPALREIAMIERYVERWQPPQGSVGASSVTEHSDVTSQGTEAREGEVEDFVQLMQQQHPSLLPEGVVDMDDDGDKDSFVSSHGESKEDAQSSQGKGNTTKKDP